MKGTIVVPVIAPVPWFQNKLGAGLLPRQLWISKGVEILLEMVGSICQDLNWHRDARPVLENEVDKEAVLVEPANSRISPCSFESKVDFLSGGMWWW